ncbi:Hexose carrier protein HEX6 [Hibiscus syriacus]|uniref:Hexose carrier protein HEX6 n=1 Tax=Hibiscus syriacus TaxID=106335 RepID=A0A6A3AKY7_HIBSY|nr:Hexose carrier protein HEX6 [Hibiscus syriacus]
MATALQITSGTAQYNGRITPLLVLLCLMASIGGVLFGYDLEVSGCLYISEMALRRHRGALNIGFKAGVTIGVLSAYLTNYFTEKINGGWGWRISLTMAAVPASIITLSTFLLPETPNSLIQQSTDNHQKAKRVLHRIRGTINVEAELDDLIKASSTSKKMDSPFNKVIQRKHRPQFVMSIAIPVFQQMTGINVITFCAPLLFNSQGESISLLSTVVTGVVGLSLISTSMLVVDKLGRRSLFMLGGALILVPQLVVGGILAAKLSDEGGLSHGCAYLVLVLICIYVAGFALSWGPLGWLVPSEIYPLVFRSAGQSITVSMGFLLCFVVGQTFLAMLSHMKSGIFYFFGPWVAAMTAFVCFFLPETKNLPVEQMELVWREHWLWRRFV